MNRYHDKEYWEDCLHEHPVAPQEYGPHRPCYGQHHLTRYWQVESSPRGEVVRCRDCGKFLGYKMPEGTRFKRRKWIHAYNPSADAEEGN